MDGLICHLPLLILLQQEFKGLVFGWVAVCGGSDGRMVRVIIFTG